MPRDELRDDTEFADLGIDHVLAQAITDRFADETLQRLPPSVFEAFPDVQSFIQHLQLMPQGQQQQAAQDDTAPTTPEDDHGEGSGAEETAAA